MELAEAPRALELDVSARMQLASGLLCSLKLEMDRYSRGLLGQPFLDDWMGSQDTCAYWGDELLRLVIPFLGWERRSGDAFQAYVDSRYVLGASIKGFPEHIPQDKVQDRITRYASVFGTRDNALYIWYRPLGILTAHEGKHRVAFMRAHDQPAIAAWVREATYPSADRIVIVQPDDRQGEWLAVLDGRYVQLLRRPRVSRMMLEAYGVKVCRWRDLTDTPSRESVLREIYRTGLHRQPQTISEEERTLDLDKLKQQERVDDECVSRNIFELKPYRCSWLRLGIATTFAFILSLVLWLLPWPVLRPGALICSGIAFGLLSGPSMLHFVGPRRVAAGSAGRDV
ncbi:hypothetical protein [Paraburkholderia caribensis]|uniref:hypothetical protein n=1 Tax=Paraburkholderia caribensis TaxID=75105 RepID=UPI000721DDC0|nr:hypothetical protein [Paraburkholderia caribensis]ALP62243.1 hypothetical protein AN416_06245 [Paraburkholderia caribensis]AUT52528.1 hypothetical protein C2L66_12185 [Paraburkholderia caribensis]